jgi:hypothetical protein
MVVAFHNDSFIIVPEIASEPYFGDVTERKAPPGQTARGHADNGIFKPIRRYDMVHDAHTTQAFNNGASLMLPFGLELTLPTRFDTLWPCRKDASSAH